MSSLTVIRQSFASWLKKQHLLHNPTMHSYLKPMRTWSPLRFATSAPRRMGLSNGNSTWTRINNAWSGLKTLLSTSITWPKPFSISHPTSLLIRLKGNPHTWIQIGSELKVTVLAVIPLSQRHNMSKWLSKLHGLLFNTHFNWLSMVNLNW